jgi:hypothetical protein
MRACDIAKTLGTTIKAVYNVAHKYNIAVPSKLKSAPVIFTSSKDRIKPFRENPNPPTIATEASICQLYYRTQNIRYISGELGRAEDFIKETLERCMKNGNYKAHNAYGRDLCENGRRTAMR